MAWLVSCVFVLVVAFNAYYAAKRAGIWSWPQFFVIIAALVIVPILIVRSLMSVRSLQDNPGLFTLITVSLIMLFVCGLAYALKIFWPLPNKKRS